MPKAIQSNTTPPCVSGGPPFWDDLLTRPMRRAFYGRPRIIAADGPVAITPMERARIGHNIHTLVDLLDAIDATEDVDAEEDNEDCCPAEDRPLPNTVMRGEFEDDEDDDPAEPSDALDHNGPWLTTVHGGLPL